MMPEYLPLKIDEKYKRRFLKSTMKLGEEQTFVGYSVSIPQGSYIREILWPALAPQIGDFSVRGLTALPSNDAPLFLVVYPKYLHFRGPIVEVTGKIMDLSIFSPESGRFLLAESVKSVSIDRYLELEKTGLSGNVIREIMDSAFSENTADVMLTYFASSSKYISRTGGNTISLLNANNKYYASNFSEIISTLSLIPNALRKNRITLYLRYDDEVKVEVNPRFMVNYSHLTPNAASKYYKTRSSKLWERSAMSASSLKLESLIKFADIPFIPMKDETAVVDPSLLKEYSLDIGFFAMQNHISNPEIDEKVLNYKSKLLERIENELPALVEAMRLGIIMDIGDVNGFGEHMARIIDAWYRISGERSEEFALNLYMELFHRIMDVNGPKINAELMVAKEKKNEAKRISRVLWELNALKPGGWDYDYFAKKMVERGIENKIYDRFQELLQGGYVIKNADGTYRAVSLPD